MDVRHWSCSWKDWAVKNLLLILTLPAVLFGFVTGVALRAFELSDEVIAWITIWGDLFIRVLKCVLVPLMFSCLVVGISSMHGTGGGKVGLAALIYILVTHVISILCAIVCAVIIKPGQTADAPQIERTYSGISYTDLLGDFLRNMFPDNFFRIFTQTGYTESTETLMSSVYNKSHNFSDLQPSRQFIFRDGPNVMGLIVVSITFGIAIKASGSVGKAVLVFFISLKEIVFKIMIGIIWMSPIGIISLMAGSLLKVENLMDVIISLGRFIGCVLFAVFIYMFLLLPVLLFPLLRRNVYKLLLIYSNAILAGFAPPSSMASLPLLLKASTEELKIDPRISSSVAPVAVNINRDGSAIFITIGVLFISQTHNIPMTLMEYTMLLVIAVILVSATGSAPSGAIVIIITICQSLGIATGERISLLMATEWLLDRMRTACNCESHAMCIVVVDKLCRKYLMHPAEQVLGHTKTVESQRKAEEVTLLVEELAV